MADVLRKKVFSNFEVWFVFRLGVKSHLNAKPKTVSSTLTT